MKRLALILGLLTGGVYAGVILWGLHLRAVEGRRERARWGTPVGASVEQARLGQAIFNHTPQYAAAYTGGALSCESCHAAGGTQPFAAPMTGVVQRFPQFTARAGRVISLEDRVRECFVRSENGTPPKDDSDVMRALLAYLRWLSPETAKAKPVGVGFVTLRALTPDPVRGAQVYAVQCAGCHGQRGEGQGMWPALWGPRSFNDGAGMSSLPKFAAFVHHNMPQNRMGILSVQDAWDVGAYVLRQPRPAMKPEYAGY